MSEGKKEAPGGPASPLGKDEEQRLQHFLRRRQLKDRMVSLLTSVKEAHDLKRGEVTTAKDAPYEDIVASLKDAIANGWLDTAALTTILDDAEIAGRQHVCPFLVDAGDLEAVKKSLLSPKTLNDEPTRLEEFWHTPLEPYTRILANDDARLLTKIIGTRKYWVELEGSIRTDDYEEIKRKRQKERAAMVIKLDLSDRLIQFRVPIRENAPGEDTAKSVYAFITELVHSQYGDEGVAWLLRLKPLRISDAFQKIIENRDDFQLHTDTPENKFFKSSMSRKGSPELGKDIRDFDQWVFDSGFARSSMRGVWKTGGEGCIDVRMHYEQVKVNDQLTRQVARLYFAKPYGDGDVEHVIRRIREHF